MRAATRSTRRQQLIPPPQLQSHARRHLHISPNQPANPVPHPPAPGPPPKPPRPSASFEGDRLARKRKQASLLKLGEQLKAGTNKPGTAWQKRFWNSVEVRTNEDGTYTILLDTRPVRSPSKSALTIPSAKPHLATAIALEWDSLVTAAQATKHHYIPLTSLASRALDIDDADRAGDMKVRDAVVEMCMGYLRTDTLLCWAPETAEDGGGTQDSMPEEGDGSKEAAVRRFAAQRPVFSSSSHSSTSASSSSPSQTSSNSTAAPAETHPTLRAVQIATATPILHHLTTHIWPGTTLLPILDTNSILPTPQPETTTQIIRGWCAGLGPWELAGLERACLAGKSLCVAARLVGEWSPTFRQGWGGGAGTGAGRDGRGEQTDCSLVAGDEVRLDDGVGRRRVDDATERRPPNAPRFGIEEAAEACSLEVRWQTQMWGEVEDTHDVDREDVRRQFGSVVLLVS